MDMHRRHFLADVAKHGLVVAAGASSCTASGCGAFLYPERCGQFHSDQIDWKVVALDSLGLLLFFVPGLVAFIVDFYTGAIWLPTPVVYPGYAAGELPANTAALAAADHEYGLQRVALSREPLRQQDMERIVSRHVGRPVSLGDGRARVSVLQQLAQYDEQASRHRADASFGFEARGVLDRLRLG